MGGGGRERSPQHSTVKKGRQYQRDKISREEKGCKNFGRHGVTEEMFRTVSKHILCKHYRRKKNTFRLAV